MLERPTCEALAAALPEVRDHRPAEGDAYYGTTEGDDAEWLCTVRAEALPGVCDMAAIVWCPRLDQLLAMAKERAGSLSLEVLPSVVMRNGPGDWWTFGPPGGTLDGGVHPSSEAAVAAWLLARVLG